jgi:membrane associated rhomboid family serine protease
MTKQAVAVLLGFVTLICGVELYDAYIGDGSLHAYGVVPRGGSVVPGVVAYAFIHGGWAHLAGNVAGLLLAGGMAATRGAAYLSWVVASGVVGGWVGVWFIGEPGVTVIGASGVLFALVGAVFVTHLVTFDNKYYVSKAVMAAALLAVVISGLIPTEGVSWEGHLAGAVAGVVCAAVFHSVENLEEDS